MKPDKTISIEPVSEQDVSALYTLLQASGLPVDGLDKHLSTAFVAKADTQIVGSAALEVYGESALLRSVAVAESWRGTGLGRQLVESAFDLARRRWVQRLYLLTETAAEWFPRFGFVPVERSAVDPAVQASIEFTSACPDSAQAMLLEIAPVHRFLSFRIYRRIVCLHYFAHPTPSNRKCKIVTARSPMRICRSL